MKNITGVLMAAVILLAGTPADAQILTADDGACAAGIFTDYAFHEAGHDWAAQRVGEKPWAPWALSGDKWDESQKRFDIIARGGFVSQHAFSAMAIAVDPDTFARCANYGDAFISLTYAIRAKLSPNDAGDYDPFSVAKRNQITFVNIMTPTLLGVLADQMASEESWRKAHSPLFRSPLGLK